MDRLVAAGRVTPVQPNRALAEDYVAMARQRLRAVEVIVDVDPEGAFVLTYDAARMALAAVLVNQGLRPRGDGAHAVLLEVVLAQLEPPRQVELRSGRTCRRSEPDVRRGRRRARGAARVREPGPTGGKMGAVLLTTKETPCPPRCPRPPDRSVRSRS